MLTVQVLTSSTFATQWPAVRDSPMEDHTVYSCVLVGDFPFVVHDSAQAFMHSLIYCMVNLILFLQFARSISFITSAWTAQKTLFPAVLCCSGLLRIDDLGIVNTFTCHCLAADVFPQSANPLSAVISQCVCLIFILVACFEAQ